VIPVPSVAPFRLSQALSAVNAIREDRVPGIAHTAVILARTVSGAGGGNDVIAAGPDHFAREEVQFGVDLYNGFSEPALVPDQAAVTGKWGHGACRRVDLNPHIDSDTNPSRRHGHPFGLHA
jgi:hypothetical protein